MVQTVRRLSAAQFPLSNVVSFLSPFSLAGRRGTEISPGMLHVPELQDVHRRWRHLRSGGEIQTVLVSLTGSIAPQEVRQHRTGPITDDFIAVYSHIEFLVFFSHLPSL